MLDQFPRNIFRGTPKAFHTDTKARGIAKIAVDRGYHLNFSNRPKNFTFLPLEHSEELEDQILSVELYALLDDDRSMRAAQGHHDAIARFGRFPHRNKVMGREKHAGRRRISQNPTDMGDDRSRSSGARKKASGTGSGP